MPFDAYSRYYDLLYRDKDYAAEVDYIDRLLQRHGVSGKDLLEFGSGTGKHGRLLAERGYRVTGIERSAEMVAQATRAKGSVVGKAISAPSNSGEPSTPCCRCFM